MDEQEPKVKRSFYTIYVKRMLDIVLSGIALIVFSPVFVVIAILELCFMGRPIIYSQERIGLHEKPFKVYKFRSMTNEKGVDGELLPNDKRLTEFGRFIRRLSIDELPQLWCIFTGKMSIIGPRPLLPEHLPFYSERHRMRHQVRPGLACYPLVIPKTWTWEDQFENDIWYIENCSFTIDLKSIFIVAEEVLIGGESRTSGDREPFTTYNPAFRKEELVEGSVMDT